MTTLPARTPGRVIRNILRVTQFEGSTVEPRDFEWSELSRGATITGDADGPWTAPSVGYSLGMLAMNAAVYLVVAWYLGQLAAQGEVSALRPWFVLDPEYWGFGRRRRQAYEPGACAAACVAPAP